MRAAQQGILVPHEHRPVVCTAVASLLPVAAAAQGVGFQADAAVDPKQFDVGSHIEFPLGSDWSRTSSAVTPRHTAPSCRPSPTASNG